jgi:subtilisin family serine protease
VRRAAILAAALAVAGVLAAPALPAPGRLSIAVDDGADVSALEREVAAATGGRLVADLRPLDSLVFAVDDLDADSRLAARLAGVAGVERLTTTRRLFFEADDPLAADQWYLDAIRAFDFWPDLPVRPPVRVAVVDSGVAGGHPDLAGRIVGSKSFVSSPALVDKLGHGTIVAGEIAARVQNGKGIAGVGIPVELLVAKVVKVDGSIAVLAEARAIRWAVDSGAQVVNLSLGGPRDPADPSRDSYSALEHAAIDYATSRGVIVVAAAGNCSRLPCPERYASYPAALPHVVGVGALAPGDVTPAFSNRDRAFVDLAAPGVKIVSTFPAPLTRPACALGPYTPCARAASARNPRGTSFAAPLAAAAAALVIGERAALGLEPLDASQVVELVEGAAVDIGVAGRDARSGYGRLDVQGALEALSRPIPPADRLEPNDDAGARAAVLSPATTVVEATLHRFDDPRDVYGVSLEAGRRVVLRLTGPSAGNRLWLWRPAATSLAASSRHPSATERIVFRPKRGGRFFVEVRLPTGRGGPYTLTIRRGG